MDLKSAGRSAGKVIFEKVFEYAFLSAVALVGVFGYVLKSVNLAYVVGFLLAVGAVAVALLAGVLIVAGGGGGDDTAAPTTDGAPTDASAAFNDASDSINANGVVAIPRSRANDFSAKRS